MALQRRVGGGDLGISRVVRMRGGFIFAASRTDRRRGCSASSVSSPDPLPATSKKTHDRGDASVLRWTGNGTALRVSLVALRNVGAGAELFAPYVALTQPVSERRREVSFLSGAGGGHRVCPCPRCRLEADDDRSCGPEMLKVRATGAAGKRRVRLGWGGVGWGLDGAWMRGWPRLGRGSARGQFGLRVVVVGCMGMVGVTRALAR